METKKSDVPNILLSDDKSLVVIKGEMIQDDTASKIQNGSCLSISLNRGNASCLAKCDIEPVFRLYIKDLKTSPNNRIPYEAVIKPRPKPGSYIFSVVLNQGWCSDGSNESLREKDLVISQGQKLTIPLVGNIDKDIKIEEYYPPGNTIYSLNNSNILYFSHRDLLPSRHSYLISVTIKQLLSILDSKLGR